MGRIREDSKDERLHLDDICLRISFTFLARRRPPPPAAARCRPAPQLLPVLLLDRGDTRVRARERERRKRRKRERERQKRQKRQRDRDRQERGVRRPGRPDHSLCDVYLPAETRAGSATAGRCCYCACYFCRERSTRGLFLDGEGRGGRE